MSTVRDLIALTKPRITTIVLATGGAGIVMAPGSIPAWKLVFSLVGTVLVVSAANALNMWWERDVDGLMERTKNRPLPAGRLGATTALVFGLALGAVATPMLFAVNALTGALGLFALFSYVVVYTPLKKRSPFALQVGAVPGAIPPLLGWTSVTGHLDAGGLLLFAILFLWQVPHFVAISLFRADDYARAGLRVYGVSRSDKVAKATIVLYTAVLVGLSVLPTSFGLANVRYLAIAVVAGGLFFGLTLKGLRGEGAERVKWARSVFGYSILYLLVVFGSLLAFRIEA
ncbi:MAG: heme o synthase [Polyangiaceae bacterium]